MSIVSCTDDCLNGVDRGEFADLTTWHHRECPNHTIACCDTTPDLCHIYFFDKGRHDYSKDEPLWSGSYDTMTELFETLSAGDYILLDDDGKLL